MLIQTSKLKIIATDNTLATQLTEARVYASIASAMLSYMLFRCKIVFLSPDDVQILTAGAIVRSNGNFIYINTGFWSTLTPKQRAFLLVHEMLHIFLEHGERCVEMMYDGELWNEATDFNINATCSGWYKTENSTSVSVSKRYTDYLEWIPKGLRDQKYTAMSSDEIYRLLQTEPRQPAQFDFVITGDLDDTGEHDAIKTQIAKNVQTGVAAIENAKAMNAIGVNELGIVKMFESLKTPKVRWQDHLLPMLIANTPVYSTYTRVSRKSGNGVIFPTYTGNSINLFIGIDTSGSVTLEQTTRFVSEVKGLLESFDSYTVNIYSCDARAYEIGTFTQDDGFDNIDWNRLKGGGGTVMGVLVDEAQDIQVNTPELNICIIFTDGYISDNDIRAEKFNGKIIVIIPEGGTELQLDNIDVIYTR
jgi:predicted metal-dependent peptidase